MTCGDAFVFGCHCANGAALVSVAAALLARPGTIGAFVLRRAVQDPDGTGGPETVLLAAVLAGAAAGPALGATQMLRLHRGHRRREVGSGRVPRREVGFMLQPAVTWFAVLVAVLYLQTSLTMHGLIALAGGAGGLLLLNAVGLMVACWPADASTSTTRAGTTTTSVTAVSAARQWSGTKKSKAADPERMPLLGEEGRAAAAPAGLSINADDPGFEESTGVAASTVMAERDAEWRAKAEHAAKLKRERGYGTFKLLELARPHRSWLFAGCAVLLIRLPFSLSIPHWVAETIGALIDSEWSVATWNIIYLCICGTCDSILDFWCVYLFGLAQQKIIRSLRLDLFAAILRQDIGFFDSTKTGEITSRLTADTAEMANDLTWVFRFTIEAIVRIGGIIGYMFIRSWRLGLLALGVIPITAVINHFYARWMRTNQEKVQTALAVANTVAEEVIASVRTVFSFAMEQGEHTRYHRKIQQYYVLVVKQVFIQGVYYMVCNTFLINTCVQASLLAYGAFLVRSPSVQMHPKILLAFMLYQGQLQEYFQNLMNSFTSLIKSSGAAAKVFEFIDRAPAYRGDSNRTVVSVPQSTLDATEFCELPSEDGNAVADNLVAPPHEIGMDVVFRDVHFSYPARPKAAVLRGLSFEASVGEVVALVGSSGSGKSTCFHLLEHFYEPQLGEVLLDGKPASSLDHGWLHRNVALVGQEPTLLSGSIEDNITYGLKDFGGIVAGPLLRAAMVRAAKEANAHSFICDLPGGYATEVGERGLQLSGGQKQRIAIARCLVRNPSLLLLDEATSALDAESEGVVQEALERAMANRTTLLIAHRLSTVRNANKIVMLDGGRVVEVGTHDELMAKPLQPGVPSYRALVQRQTLG